MTRGSSSLTMAMIIAAAARACDLERAKTKETMLAPASPAPTCSVCGVTLLRHEHSTINHEPAPKCLHCIEATPGRERMAAKRARRAKRADMNHHGREA
jgi:hypothetical protein